MNIEETMLNDVKALQDELNYLKERISELSSHCTLSEASNAVKTKTTYNIVLNEPICLDEDGNVIATYNNLYDARKFLKAYTTPKFRDCYKIVKVIRELVE